MTLSRALTTDINTLKLHSHVRYSSNSSVHVVDTCAIPSPIVQFWLSGLTFVYGFLMDGAVAVIGLCAMEVVPKSLAGSAHGLACALAQGTYILLML